MHFKLLIFISLSCFAQANSARILGVFHNPSRSHFFLGNTLMESLARRGHQVTILSPYPYNTTLENYEVIEIDGLQLSKDVVIERVRAAINGTLYSKLKSLQENYQKITKLFLNHKKIQNFLNSNRKYDMVIIDWLFNEAFLGIAHHFKAHSVVFSGIGSSSTINKVTANPAPSSYVTNILPAVSDEMTLVERILNTASRLVFAIRDIQQTYEHNRLLAKHFPGSPNVDELSCNVSLVLLNSHFTIETPRPYVPSMVTIGGFHIQKTKPLTQDLKMFLDNATEGVLLFSFGSIVKSSELGTEKIQMLIKTFAKLPLKVLWKFEGDFPNLPSNVKIAKWLPQTDVLAHPNVKLFVSHGGLLSILETIYHSVPVIVVPFFADQEANAALAAAKGYGKKISFHNLNEVTLAEAVRDLINDTRYKKNMEERSRWFRDRPEKPLDTAIYWIEYVLTHNGAHHLKTAAVKLSWYQYYLLDIVVILTAIFVLMYYMLRCMIRFITATIPKKQFNISKKVL